MTESEFFLWVAFIATTPPKTKGAYGSPLNSFRDFIWWEYVATNKNESINSIFNYQEQFDLNFWHDSPQEIINKINEITENVNN